MINLCFDKSRNICYTNFWPDFYNSPFKYYFINTINNKNDNFRIVKHYNPHIHFFSVFGNKKNIIKSKAKYKIFFTGENVNDKKYISYRGNCINDVDLSLGFDYCNADNYLRFPLWLLYYFNPENTKDNIKQILNNFKIPYQKSKFCSLISRQDNNGIRTKIYKEISKIANVDCPGRLLYNDDSLQNIFNDNKSLYLRQYKFNICPENSISKGYVTEKIFECLNSGCIPIYNGWSNNPEPDIINPDIILWYDEKDEQNNQNILKEIKLLNENDKFYSSFVSRPFFCDTAVEKIYNMLNQYNTKLQNLLNL